jgi:methyl-accepting chemotaxis protein
MKNKRRAFPVASSVQYTFLAFAIAYGFIAVLFVGTVVFVPDFMEMGDESLSTAVRSAAASRILDKHTWALPACLSLILIIALHSFRRFHRIMGPLYRFRCAFDEFAKGNLRYPVKIRKKDYLHAEEDKLNHMVDSLSERLKSIKETTESALHSIRDIEEAVNPADEWVRIKKESLAEHRKCLENLETSLLAFQLRGEDR